MVKEHSKSSLLALENSEEVEDEEEIEENSFDDE